MMCAVRRLSGTLAGLVSLAAVVAVGVPVSGATDAGAAPGAVVRTLVGPGQLDTPGGIALDAAGDLFIADTGHCRVLVVPARDGTRYGLHLHAGHAATLAGGTCAGAGSIGHPSGVAVDVRGDVYIAEATAQRVQVVRPAGRAIVAVAGTGRAGFNGDGLAGLASELDEPTGVAVDASGDLFIADTANCRVRVLPAATTTLFGRAVTAGHLSTIAGTGVCGSAGQGGPVAAAQLWNPVAVTVDSAGDLLVADDGDQSVLLAPVRAGTYYGTPVGAGDIGVVVGGAGGYQPYLADGAPAAGETAELNDPRHRRRPNRRALRHRWPHAGHPGGALDHRRAVRAHHDGGRPLQRGGRGAGRHGGGTRGRDAVGAHPDGHALRRRGVTFRRRVLQRRQPRHRADDRRRLT